MIKKRAGTNQKGQATTEYVLMLILGVGLAFSLGWTFNKAFQTWGEAYFGSYFRCLIVNGELPILLKKNGQDTDDLSSCEKFLEDFELDFQGTGSSSTAGGSKTRGSTKSQIHHKQPNNTSVGSGTRSNGTEVASTSNRFRVSSSDKSSKKKSSSSSKKEDDSSINAKSVDTLPVNNRSYKKFKITYATESEEGFGDYGEDDEAYKDPGDKKIKGKKNKAPQKIANTGQAVRLKVNPNEKKRKIAQKEIGFDWSASNLIKYLLIIALGIFILIVVGGQLLSIAKSFKE